MTRDQPNRESADPGAGIGDAKGWFRAHPKEWILVLGTVAAALITGLFTYLSASADNAAEPPPATTPTPGGHAEDEDSSDTDAAAGPPDPTAPAASNGTARPAAPGVQWQGALLLDGGGKDLDAGPPAAASGESDVSTSGVGGDYSLNALGGSVSVWDDSGGLPEHADCAEAADAAGTSSAPVEPGAVLCLRTDEGRLARLQVTDIPDVYGPTVEFDALVWSLPEAGTVPR
ncbi:hypothetical protein FZ103_08000 [Streptomonospora sp. PA3]|uniref:hypothetical protein n=1 Tax=Streptomonospora sp. PA3 TaxID=2607326 RepID=UPI0012DE62D1|nr:hypothetical protein [Streptomonospora sp. PA3]MUL41124.1 hypothetical protein [Streptomonospora sp. PA3]